MREGGAGADELRRNGGADGFLFRGAPGLPNIDTIAGFSVAADTIPLENAIFTALAGTGPLTADPFAANTTGLASDSAQRIVHEPTPASCSTTATAAPPAAPSSSRLRRNWG